MRVANIRSTTILSILSLAFFAATHSFAAERIMPQQIKNYEAPGNLESTRELGCVATEKLTSKSTPVELYQASLACINNREYQESAVTFALAGVYGRFDTLRVSDESAHQALSVLKMQFFSGMLPEQQNKLLASVIEMADTPKNLAEVCNTFTRIGPPDYYPRYMIQHGLGAFNQSQADNGLIKDFNSSEAWRESLDGYLHCKDL